MLPIQKLTPKDYLIQPWKNGQGETQEIAVDSLTPFRWRVSSATLSASGPFSLYPGYERVLVLLSGPALLLTLPSGKKREVQFLSPYRFSGDVEIAATVTGDGRDFNVFAQKVHARSGVYVSLLNQSEEYQFPLAGQEHFLYCVSGEISIRERNKSQTFALSQYETLRLSRDDDTEYLNLSAIATTPQATCLWVVLHLT